MTEERTEPFTVKDFEPYLKQTFKMAPKDAAGIEVQLAEVKDLTPNAGKPDLLAPPGTVQRAFSLLFRGAPNLPVLPQGIYKFDNTATGKFSLFVVPVAAHEGGVFYEAVFN